MTQEKKDTKEGLTLSRERMSELKEASGSTTELPLTAILSVTSFPMIPSMGGREVPSATEPATRNQ